ncbi:hypothetical protein GDO78_003048 [Eleutherodactylus coqui]|uniref:Uncharacterized protein n=1 Tax=Eleutherodactylus coqui TaxID=57060 RepID=A0A8J6EV65_ELECQ|nr:hypothetical protein GDO78_003048 [Eleutherodactylus coqui]
MNCYQKPISSLKVADTKEETPGFLGASSSYVPTVASWSNIPLWVFNIKHVTANKAEIPHTLFGFIGHSTLFEGKSHILYRFVGFIFS